MNPPTPTTNRLIHETSPYLRQHAHNPVDWFPWGDEALKKARELDRPIFLSVGYSACHWCHVMEHESFEDPEVGKLLGDHFISIKVDREERPDLDQIYMTAVQLMTRHGGWPMSVFLTPDLKPFYGGTYFPPSDRHGLPSFKNLLTAIADAWTKRRGELVKQSEDLTNNIQRYMQLSAAPGALNEQLLRGALGELRHSFDPTFGGFGVAPKFPHPMDLRLLLRLWKRFGDDQALQITTRTLDLMARGGIYDHLGGGFHRYSTDARWLVPHFEKMLYDNALLTTTYLEAYQATKNPFYREVVEETLAYVGREMTSPDGPFFSTQDADSEGVEGKFFVWSKDEIGRVLDRNEAALFCSVYDVTEDGNWEEHNILHRARPDEQEAKLLQIPVEDLHRRLAESKRKLLDARGSRIKPGLDDKLLTSWNALMIAAYAKAAQVLGNPIYERRASAAATYVLHHLRSTEGRLYRTSSASNPQPRLNAYLDDYAYLIDALVTLYETTFDLRWINASLNLAGIMIEQFWDADGGGFFYTGKDHETLIARGKDPHDNATPSGNSVAVCALLRLSKLTGNRDFHEKAETTLAQFHGIMTDNSRAAGQMLLALDFYLGPVAEVVVVGPYDGPEVLQALKLLREGFRPNQVLAWKPAEGPAEEAEKALPLLVGREAKGPVTTYVCQNFTCAAPLVGVKALEEELSL